MAETGGPKLLFSGFLTKRGHFRKNWKRRHFELTSDKKLRYYVVSSHRQEAGCIDLSRCTQVAPGGRCKITWYSGANPHLCFGIFTSNRCLFVFSQTKEDLEAWLQVLRGVVPKGVPVTTPEEIALSWEGRRKWSAVPTTEDNDILYRVTVFANGKPSGGKVLELPASFDKLRILASDAMGFPVTAVCAPDGQQLTDIGLINDDDVVVVSAGEPFSCPPDAVWQPRLLSGGAGADALDMPDFELGDDDDEAAGRDAGEENLEAMLRRLEVEASGLKERLEDGTALGIIPEGGDEEEGAAHAWLGEEASDEENPREDYDNLDLALDDPEGPYISLQDIQAMRQLEEQPEDPRAAPSSRAASTDAGYVDVADTAAAHAQQDTGYVEVGDARGQHRHAQQDTGYMEVGDTRGQHRHTQQDTGYMEVGDTRSGGEGRQVQPQHMEEEDEDEMNSSSSRTTRAEDPAYLEVATAARGPEA